MLVTAAGIIVILMFLTLICLRLSLWTVNINNNLDVIERFSFVWLHWVWCIECRYVKTNKFTDNGFFGMCNTQCCTQRSPSALQPFLSILLISFVNVNSIRPSRNDIFLNSLGQYYQTFQSFFYFKMGHSRPLFPFISSFLCSWQ